MGVLYLSHDSVCTETVVDIRYHCRSRHGMYTILYSCHDSVCTETIVDTRYHCRSRQGIYMYVVYSSHDSVCIETIVDIRYHCMSRRGIFLYMLRGYRCIYILINVTYVLNILFIIHILINNIYMCVIHTNYTMIYKLTIRRCGWCGSGVDRRQVDVARDVVPEP